MGLVLVTAAAGLCGWLFRAPIEQAGQWFVGGYGLPGLFAAVWACDTSVAPPLTHEPVMLLALSGGRSAFEVFWVSSAASVCAGPTGWMLGFAVDRWTPLGAWLRRRQPQVMGLIAQHGARAVAVAAILPIPYAISTWLAGMSGVSLPKVALASLLRIPKVGFYLMLLVQGWSLGA